MLTGNILITGGCGTLGKAIIERAIKEKWLCNITVYSRDWIKHAEIKTKYPQIKTVVGDILDMNSLNMAVAGHNIVIHAAAMKHIVEAEHSPAATYETNVAGSANVLEACVQQQVRHVIGISTDKAAHPANAYGASKLMMEKLFQQYSEAYSGTQTLFHLVRYGNVIGSTGAFIHNWMRDLDEYGFVHSTDADMTRFWLTPKDAVDLILLAQSRPDSDGMVIIPIPRSTSIGDLEQWLLPENTKISYMGHRPGEKLHETLLTEEERRRAEIFEHNGKKYARIYPSSVVISPDQWELQKERVGAIASCNPELRMCKEEFMQIFEASK